MLTVSPTDSRFTRNSRCTTTILASRFALGSKFMTPVASHFAPGFIVTASLVVVRLPRPFVLKSLRQKLHFNI